jgi:hypothetical protein
MTAQLSRSTKSSNIEILWVNVELCCLLKRNGAAHCLVGEEVNKGRQEPVKLNRDTTDYQQHFWPCTIRWRCSPWHPCQIVWPRSSSSSCSDFASGPGNTYLRASHDLQRHLYDYPSVSFRRTRTSSSCVATTTPSSRMWSPTCQTSHSGWEALSKTLTTTG